MKFLQMDARPADVNERNDCAVRATVCASALPYAEVHAAYAAAGRAARRGTPWSVCQAAARALFGPDVEIVKFDANYELIGSPWRRRWHASGRPTLAQFAAQHRKGCYIVVIKGHAFALVDGVQLDTAPNGSRCRVMCYIKVPE